MGPFEAKRQLEQRLKLVERAVGAAGDVLTPVASIPVPECLPAEDGVVLPPDLCRTAQTALDYLLSGLRNCAFDHICLEGGHIYADETVTPELESAIHATALAKRHLTRNGFAVTSVLLVDDYHPLPHERTLDYLWYLRFCASKGLGFNYIAYEAQLVPLAHAIVEWLLRQRRAVSTSSCSAVHLLHRNVELIKEGRCSCALLDAALYYTKLQYAGKACVTVLPALPTRRSQHASMVFRSQQKKTRVVLSAVLDFRAVPVFNIYVTGGTEMHLTSTVPGWIKFRRARLVT